MLTLYVKDHCRFSKRVLDAMRGVSVPCEIKNISNDILIEDELKSVSGSTQVPYLVDAAAGKKMNESEAIIAYLAALPKQV